MPVDATSPPPRSPPMPPRAVPALLALVAGAVDACTVLGLFGLFVAQLTGSFVIVGVELVRQQPAALIHVMALPLFFAAGAAIAILAQSVAAHALAVSLAVEAALLAAFMATGIAAAPFTDAGAPDAVLASALGLLAMGVQNASVRMLLPGVASTNVMTMNTTQLAIDVAQWGLATWRSTPPGAQAAVQTAGQTASQAAARAAASRIGTLGPIMASFFAGTVVGALGFVRLGFWSLAPHVAILLALAWWAVARRPA